MRFGAYLLCLPAARALLSAPTAATANSATPFVARLTWAPPVPSSSDEREQIAFYLVSYKETAAAAWTTAPDAVLGLNATAALEEVQQVSWAWSAPVPAAVTSQLSLRLGVTGAPGDVTGWLPMSAPPDAVYAELRKLRSLRPFRLDVAASAAGYSSPSLGAAFDVGFAGGAGLAPLLYVAETNAAAVAPALVDVVAATVHRTAVGGGRAVVCTADVVAATGRPCSHVLTGLLPGRSYQFRVQAVGGGGVGGLWSGPTQPLRVAAPEGLTPDRLRLAAVEAVEVGRTHGVVNVGLSGAADGSAVRLEVETAAGGGGAWVRASNATIAVQSRIGPSGGAAFPLVSYTVRLDGLDSGSRVGVRVRAALAAAAASADTRTPWSQPVFLATLPPLPPPPPFAPFRREHVTQAGVVLSWSDVFVDSGAFSGELLGYAVEAAEQPSSSPPEVPGDRWFSVRSLATRQQLLRADRVALNVTCGTGGEAPSTEDAWGALSTATTAADEDILSTFAPDSFAAAASAVTPLRPLAERFLTVLAPLRTPKTTSTCSYSLLVPVDEAAPPAEGLLRPLTMYRFRIRAIIRTPREISLVASGTNTPAPTLFLAATAFSPASQRIRTRAPHSELIRQPRASPTQRLDDRPARPALVSRSPIEVRLSWEPFLWRLTELQRATSVNGMTAAPSVGYVIEAARGSASADFQRVWDSRLNGSSQFTAHFSELEPDSIYRYRVVAVSSGGEDSAPSDELAVTTPTLVSTAPRWRQVDTNGLEWDGVSPRPPAWSAASVTTPGVEGGGGIAAARGPPPLRGASLTAIGSDYLYLFGGYTPGYRCEHGGQSDTCRSGGGLRNETWRLNRRSLTWSLLDVSGSGALPPRELHVAAEAAGALYVYGGLVYADNVSSATTPSSELWRLDVGGGPDGNRAGVIVAGSTVPLHTDSASPSSADASCGSSAIIGGNVTTAGGASQPCGIPRGRSITLPLDLSNLTVAAAAGLPAGSCVSRVRVFVQLAHACPRRVRLHLSGPRRPSFHARGAAVDAVVDVNGDVSAPSVTSQLLLDGTAAGEIAMRTDGSIRGYRYDPQRAVQLFGDAAGAAAEALHCWRGAVGAVYLPLPPSSRIAFPGLEPSDVLLDSEATAASLAAAVHDDAVRALGEDDTPLRRRVSVSPANNGSASPIACGAGLCPTVSPTASARPLPPLLPGRVVKPAAQRALNDVFRGRPVHGMWTLTVTDTGDASPASALSPSFDGEVRRWGLVLDVSPCAPTYSWTLLPTAALDGVDGTALPRPAIVGGSAVVAGGRWYVGGDRDPLTLAPRLWQFDFAAAVWTRLPQSTATAPSADVAALFESSSLLRRALVRPRAAGAANAGAAGEAPLAVVSASGSGTFVLLVSSRDDAGGTGCTTVHLWDAAAWRWSALQLTNDGNCNFASLAATAAADGYCSSSGSTCADGTWRRSLTVWSYGGADAAGSVGSTLRVCV